MPPMSSFPKSHQVTYNYYVGVVKFLEEDYEVAEQHLTAAYNLCLASSPRNIQLILIYLIPTKLITNSVLPTEALLAPYPGLQELLGPIARCISRGDLAGFDAALQAGEDEFVKRRVYLTLERGRDVCMRNLFRQVYLAGGFEVPKEDKPETTNKIRRSRFSISEFVTAVRMSGKQSLESEEVECLIANMIYKVCLASTRLEFCRLILSSGHDERLHFAAASDGGHEQERRRVSQHRRVRQRKNTCSHSKSKCKHLLTLGPVNFVRETHALKVADTRHPSLEPTIACSLSQTASSSPAHATLSTMAEILDQTLLTIWTASYAGSRGSYR